MAEFKDSYITEEERKALLIQNLADRPNAMSSYGRAKMSAEDLKKAFDDQFILVVDRHNLLHKSVEEIRGEAQTERLESLENRTETLDTRADTLDTRADTLEGRADTLDTRADSLEDRADTVEGRLGAQNDANSIEDVIQRVANLENLLDDPNNQDTLNESYRGVRERVKQNENDISKNAEQIGYINTYLDRDPSDSANIFFDVYPVGSIYMSVNPTDPAYLFGGSWVALTDRFLVGAGGSYGVTAKGGATSHKHGSGTLGATVTMAGSSILISSIQQKDGINHKPTAKINASTRDTYTGETDYIVPVIGSTGEANYLPPYYAVYMWRREA